MNMAPEVGVDHLTMLDVSPPDLVSVAREARFDLVSLRVVAATPSEEPWPMTAGAPMLEETARRLDDTGVRVRSVRGHDRRGASLRPATPDRDDPLYPGIEPGRGGLHRRTLRWRRDPAGRAPLPALRWPARTTALAGPRSAVLCAALRRAAHASDQTAASPQAAPRTVHGRNRPAT